VLPNGSLQRFHLLLQRAINKQLVSIHLSLS
jgi:hypothetical protein